MFGKKKEEIVQEEPVVTEVEEKEPEVFKPANRTLVGKGVSFIGDFISDDEIEINGTVEGKIQASKTLEVGECGSYKGNASIQQLLAKGHISGSVICHEIARFTATAVMNGELSTKKLITDEGSCFDGTLSIIKTSPEKSRKEEPEEPAATENIFE